MLLAWLSPLLPCLALVYFWMSLVPAPSDKENLKQGDRAAFAKANREAEQALNARVGASVAVCALGVALAVAGLFGIRTGRGAALVVPGACLGIISALIVTALVGMVFLAAGIKV